MKLYKREAIPFIKFVEYLLPPSLDLEGCEVLFPDSVFFGDDGKPIFVAKTDKDGRMILINQPNKLGLTDIKNKFSALVREWKNDTKTILQCLAEKEKSTKEKEAKTSATNSPTNADGKKSNAGLSQIAETTKMADQPSATVNIEKEKNKEQYADAMILRHRREEDGVRVLTENQTFEVFNRRTNDPYFQKIEVVQTCVKSMYGNGQFIYIKFFAKINE